LKELAAGPEAEYQGGSITVPNSNAVAGKLFLRLIVVK
jgi:hypothetical protein